MKICGYFTKCKEIWKCLSMASRTVGVSKEKYGTSRRDFYAYWFNTIILCVSLGFSGQSLLWSGSWYRGINIW